MSEVTTDVFVGRVEVGTRLLSAPGIAVHVGTDEDGEGVTIMVLKAVATNLQRVAFENIVRHAELTGLTIIQQDEHTIVAKPRPEGTLASLPTLDWKLDERLEILWRIADLFQRFHLRRTAIGPLPPKYILINSELEPYILGPRIAPRGSAYSAPETVTKNEFTMRSDVFTVGKLLYFCLALKEPPRESEEVPRLTELLPFPAGLVRIIRKATCLDPSKRYALVDDLLSDVSTYDRYEEVGLGHNEVEEANFGRLSMLPPTPNVRLSMAPAPRKAPKPAKKPAKPVDFYVPGKKVRRRAVLAAGILLSLGGLVVIGKRIASEKPDLAKISAGELVGMSDYVISASLSVSEPPVLFAHVKLEWDKLPLDEQREQAKHMLNVAVDRWGVRNGFVHRENVMVAQFANRHVILLPSKAGN